MQTAFGIDSPDEMTFELNYKAVLRDLGYAPKIGSRLKMKSIMFTKSKVFKN